MPNPAEPEPTTAVTPDAAAHVIAELTRRGETVAIAESLTGGLLAATLIAVPGASAAVSGAVVAYNTAIKHSVLGVDAALLAERGAVDPEVARQMADGVRRVLAVDGRAADYGIATTGVAGPDPQNGQPPGVVYLGVASAAGIRSVGLRLSGDRTAVRAASVNAALEALREALGGQRPHA
ncbi:CinA family protein [Microterricola pindariensis]|uniref:Damage-inducible protein CinA n=1 Tax=Microterricola pindariensis TaxID=478010 RepID=A0ABX5AWJ7_9MICO|nr:nicotinamide-nucleotide amidohydrolase family protein [Microterricola pindariensis]PPL19267.1 damage-inducible protein CinA [Microterricola pindariensis]